MSIGFVLGNGKSREPIPLEPLKKYGTIYGCNAVYRDFSPDYLVAVDVKMVNEINMKRYQMDNQVWTNYNKSFESYTNFNYFEPSLGWSSGPSALSLCTTHNHKAIYILGFDFQGIGTEKRRVNNIYSGTQNYKRSDDGATYFGNWLRQTCNVIQKNVEKRYIRVLEKEDSFIPEPFNNFANLSHITVEDFKKSFNISAYIEK